MYKIKLPMYGVRYQWRCLRRLTLTIGIVGLLVLNAGAFSTAAHAGQEEDLRTSLSELLFKAVRANDINAVRTVVEAGADLARVNMRGNTAMDIAVNRGHFDIAQYLVFARRIEQQTNLNATPPVSTVRQSSPEAAPVVEATKAQPVAKNPVEVVSNTAPSNAKKTAPKTAEKRVAKKPNKPTYNQLMSAAKRLAAAAEALANQSTPDPIVSFRKLAQSAPPVNAPTEAAPKAVEVAEVSQPQTPFLSAPVYVIGPNGRLVQATHEQIRRAQMAMRPQAAKQVEPDVEKRKSIFIPKPRYKPAFRSQYAVNRSNRAEPIVQPTSQPASLPTSRIPKTTTPRIEVPAFAKPAIPRVSQGNVPQSVHIRPTRRISPQLLEKLRRRLRTTKKRKQIVSDGAPDLLDAPRIMPPSLPKAVKIAPLLPVKNSPAQVSEVVSTARPAEEPTAVRKIVNGLSNLFGLNFGNSETKPEPKIKVAENKVEVEIAKVEVVAKPQPKPIPIITIPQALPQNSSTGFETRTVPQVTKPQVKPLAKLRAKPQTKPQTKPMPIEVAIAVRKNIESPRIQIVPAPSARKKPMVVPTPKTASPTVFSSIKEVLFPGATVQPKVDASISDTAKNKAKDSSLRRLTRAMPLNRLRKPLNNVLLTLGDSVRTGQTQLPRGMAEPDACVRKRRGSVAFCIVPVDWPREIEPSFAVNTSLYQGTRAIARYDKGKASHFHALFASVDQNKIVEFLTKRYGPPTDIWKRMIAPLASLDGQTRPMYGVATIVKQMKSQS